MHSWHTFVLCVHTNVFSLFSLFVSLFIGFYFLFFTCICFFECVLFVSSFLWALLPEIK